MSVVRCDNPRVCAIKIITNGRSIIIIVIISVYMPTNAVENVPEFTDCLGRVSAIIDDHGVESVYILGDFNSYLSKLFYNASVVNKTGHIVWIRVS